MRRWWVGRTDGTAGEWVDVPEEGDVPEPGGIRVLPEDDQPGDTYLIAVRVHEDANGVRWVHPSTVMELLRAMMQGSATETFCANYEATLRRYMDEVVERNKRGET